ncbi:hypothetical protein BDP81DRAFT_329459, partial [Colletotrichum phormii]
MKIDRNKLNALGRSLSSSLIVSLSLGNRIKTEPQTDMEFQIRDVWARLLGVDAGDIGRNDSFLRIGGDSLGAIRLVSVLRQSGIALTVAAIFQDSRLSHMASIATVEEETEEDTRPQPFSLLSAGDHTRLISEALKACELPESTVIEDIYPCTQLQEGLIALSVKQTGSYRAKFTYQLSEFVHQARFMRAWEATLACCDNLRTRIVFAAGSSYQVVLQQDVSWDSAETTNSIAHDEMTYGSRLCRYALVSGNGGSTYFVLTLHHAIYDGWAMELMTETLKSHYYGSFSQDLPAYSRFVRLTTTELDHAASQRFWEEQLREAKRATFPLPAVSSTRKHEVLSKPHTESLRRIMSFPRSTASKITKATIIRAAWAMLLARYCDSDDVCFATTVSGRQAAVEGIDRIVGPTLATVPIYAQVGGDRSVEQYLNEVQDRATATIPHEQFGLQNISRISSDIKDVCDFTSLLVIQPGRTMAFASSEGDAILIEANDEEDPAASQTVDGHFNYPLVMQGQIYDEEVHLLAVYDSSVLTKSQIGLLCEQLNHVAQQLVKHQGHTRLQDITIAGPADLQKVLAWNTEETEVYDACLHQLFEKQAHLTPDAPAVHSWDGTFTYSELNGAANRLAHHLAAFEVQLDEFVHVYFEKSAWYVVAILAINKAGGTWVPLDPSHPDERQLQIVSQTGARLVLTSPHHSATCQRLVESVIEISPALDENLLRFAPSSNTTLSGPKNLVCPSNAAYVLFTSGSTGVPKGLVMEHGSVCTSQTAIGRRLRISPDVRMLQFASYVFDLSIGEIFCPLLHGASVCIPSEDSKMGDLSAFVQKMNVNWAILTPSYIRTTRPDRLPGLELLVLAGEAVGRDNLDTWFGKVRLVNGWGPAETCVFSAIHEYSSLDDSPLTVGRPVGGYGYIVDPVNAHQLAPVGCLGELVIQGPTILREYLSDAERTAAATVPAADWSSHGTSPKWSRFYMSGD